MSDLPDNSETDKLGKAIADWKSERDEAEKAKEKWPFIAEMFTIFGFAFIFSLALRVFLFQPFIIPSGSMHKTLMEGDRILVNKLYPKPFELNRRDVIVFKDPGDWLILHRIEGENNDNVFQSTLRFVGVLPTSDDEYLTKRLIGLPGDHITCDGNGGKIIINGVPQEEEYVPQGMLPSQVAIDVTVPANMIYVLGDNRSNSADSRYNTNKPYYGFVPMENVVGKAFAIIWPQSRWSGI